MRIGIICYPTVGGSGIVATELAIQLAARGHEVHIVSSETPFRLDAFYENTYFHQVQSPTHPLFQQPPYLLSLANKLVEVHRRVGLDIIHAHYAVPHATAAYLAREMIGSGAPRVVTTLHGTDITLMAADPSFVETIAFGINRSDAVTAVSQSLRAETLQSLPVTQPVQVIPNFLDCTRWYRQKSPRVAEWLKRGDEKVVMHMSNFRKVKRTHDVVRIFALIAKKLPARLVMVGDGPEVKACCDLVNRVRLRDQVIFLGSQENVVPLLSAADLFLLPSEQESFGLAALEAMACGVPVVASSVGGLPEVVVDGLTGFLCPPGDVQRMAERAVLLLQDLSLHAAFRRAGETRVRTSFCARRIVPFYEELYHRVLEAGPVTR